MPNSCVVFHYATLPHFLYPFTSQTLVSRVWVLWIVLWWHKNAERFSELCFWRSLGYVLRHSIVGSKVAQFLVFWGIFILFYKKAGPTDIHTSTKWEHFLPTVALTLIVLILMCSSICSVKNFIAVFIWIALLINNMEHCICLLTIDISLRKCSFLEFIYSPFLWDCKYFYPCLCVTFF